MAAAVEASATQLLDLTVGSTLRAVLEANASIGLWMQWLILQVLRTTRAATSNGADLDSWMADLTLTRLPAVAATGTVTLLTVHTGHVRLDPGRCAGPYRGRHADICGERGYVAAFLVGGEQWLRRARRRGLAGCAGDRADTGERRQRAGWHNFPAGIGHCRASIPSATSTPSRMASMPSPMMHSGAVSTISSPAGRAPHHLRWVMRSAAFSRG